MRNKRPIDALFPETRRAILATMLLEPQRSWYLSDLAAHLGRRNPSSLQRELDSLVSAQIVVRREEGNRVYFQANQNSPIYPELAGLLAKTTGLVEIVGRTIRPFQRRVKVAFIHGSLARGEEHAASDVDLLVVGDVGLSELSQALRPAEDKLARPINAATYAADEFSAKVQSGNHFLATVLKREKVFLVGGEDVLEELVAGRQGAASLHEQTGTG